MPLAMNPILEFLANNWAITAFICTLIAGVLIFGLVVSRYLHIALNIMRSTRPPLYRNPLDYDRFPSEPVSFTAYDGLLLQGMLIRAPTDRPRRGLVVFAHEYCSDMHSCARYCRPLHDAGYDVFAFDFRGHGESSTEPGYEPRQWVTEREVADLRGAIAFVEDLLRREGRPVAVGVMGVSRGACAAILVARENPRVRALFLDGAFSTDSLVEHFILRWAEIYIARQWWDFYPPAFWRFVRTWMIARAERAFRCRFPSVRKALDRLGPLPMFFVHGQKDSYLPVEQSRRLYALAPQPKYLWVAPDARHNQAAVRHPVLYAELIVNFFDRHLARLRGTPTVATAALGGAEDSRATGAAARRGSRAQSPSRRRSLDARRGDP